jgi:glyoxylase-like metal-dependent hydrolase (beta-lactamase superfamily II)
MAVRTTEPTEIASGVWRLGTELVNWYLVEEGGRLTVVDAGAPKYRPQLDAALARLGRGLGDVAAIVLTHAHSDHTGFAEQLRGESGVPVYVHPDDESLAATGKLSYKREASFLPYLRYGHAWRLIIHLAGAGAMKPRPIRELRTYSDGETLEVPGRPRVIHTPGHSPGHCSLFFESAGALIAGDAICTLNPFTGARGPQLMPRAFNQSSAQCLDSLTKLEGIEAEVVAVGHGEPWREGVAAAVERTRATGPT